MSFIRSVCLAALAAACLPLGACQQSSEPAADSAPEAKPGIAVEEGRLVLPAVSGNPAAAYFNLVNSSESATTLVGVFVEGAATAELHETVGGSMSHIEQVQLEPGTTVSFEPGGKHVMVFDVSDQVSAAGSAEMTLTFADGDKVSSPLKVESLGGTD